MKKKLFAMLLVVVMITSSFIVSSCGNNDAPTAPPADGETPAEGGEDDVPAADLPEGGRFWLTDTPVTVSMFVSTRPLVDDFVDNEFTVWFSEVTNVNFDFTVAPEAEAREIFNLLLAAGDYPDMQMNPWIMSRPEINALGQQGIFIPVNDLIADYAPRLERLLRDYPEAVALLTLEGGNMYSIPTISDVLHMSNPHRKWIYQPWLDELGLAIPETTEEFYDMLTAFRDHFPGSVPAVGAHGTWNGLPTTTLMNSFVHHNGHDMTWVEDGVVSVVYNTDEWKEGLLYMRRLTESGLLARDTWTQDQESLIRLGENPDGPVVGVTWGGFQGIFADLTNMDRWPNYIIAPPLEGPNGFRMAPYNFNYRVGMGVQITDAAERPDIAIGLLDLMYEWDVFMRHEHGIEGIHWRRAEPDEMGFAGPGIWVPLFEYGTLPRNLTWDQMGVSYQPESHRVGQVIDVELNPLEKILFEGTRDMNVPFRAPVANQYPNVLFTEEEAIEMSLIQSELQEFVGEMTARFVTGDVDIIDGWDAYLHDLERLNLSRFLEIRQAAMDRLNN